MVAYLGVSINLREDENSFSSHPLGSGGATPAGAYVAGSSVRADNVSKGKNLGEGRPKEDQGQQLVCKITGRLVGWGRIGMEEDKAEVG